MLTLSYNTSLFPLSDIQRGLLHRDGAVSGLQTEVPSHKLRPGEAYRTGILNINIYRKVSKNILFNLLGERSVVEAERGSTGIWKKGVRRHNSKNS